mmetsp:Transcript_13312/g.30354  ORF Transcript_13312/g.30354 Transcript_13312/m.30354 type:complete len:360 (-) Transcript_13312:205-1284(-)
MSSKSSKSVARAAPRRTCLQKQLRKTKLCTYHFKGLCQFGEECAFAHAAEEVEESPDLIKTRLCKAFQKGSCTKEDCSFAHGEEELRSTAMFYKKTLCFWNSRGKCRSGNACRFAHSVEELRAYQRAAAASASNTSTSASDGNSSHGGEGSECGGSSVHGDPQQRKQSDDGLQDPTRLRLDLDSAMPMKIHATGLWPTSEPSPMGRQMSPTHDTTDRDAMIQQLAGMEQQDLLVELLRSSNSASPYPQQGQNMQEMLEMLKYNIHNLSQQWAVLQQVVSVQKATSAPQTASSNYSMLPNPGLHLFPDYSMVEPVNPATYHEGPMMCPSPPPGLSQPGQNKQMAFSDPFHYGYGDGCIGA